MRRLLIGLALLSVAGCAEPPLQPPPVSPTANDLDNARRLLAEDAVRTWCRTRIAGQPMLKPDYQTGLCP